MYESIDPMYESVEKMACTEMSVSLEFDAPEQLETWSLEDFNDLLG